MKNGFTLVELSIVLVIIGLLIGGILVGQSLIDSTKINQAVRQIQQYDIAVSQFQNKFRQLPGDSNLFTLAGNNDGDFAPGDIIAGAGVPECGASICRESMSFWKHLSDANILQENYTINSDGLCSEAGNCPSLLGANLSVSSFSFIDSPAIIRNFYVPPSSTDVVLGVEALAIDSKIDDGDSESGDIRSSDQDDTLPFPCTATTIGCAMIIRIMSTNGG